MKNSQNINGNDELLFNIDDKPNLLTQIIMGLQNIFAAFGGIIAVPLVICSALGLDGATSTTVLSATILASGIATIIQSKGIGRVGARVPTVMGTDFTFVSPALAVVTNLVLASDELTVPL